MLGTAGGLNATQSAIEALKSGKDVGSVYGESTSESQVETTEGSENEELQATEEPTEETSNEEASEESKPEAKVEDIEEIILTDENGKRKVKVDWNDREKLKQYVQMAHGMRKFQAERDKARKELDSYKSENGGIKETYDALNQAWMSGGEEGLINLLAGKPDAFAEMEKRIVAKHQFLANATPEQKKAYDIEQQNQALLREKERLVKEQQEFLAKLNADKAAAEAKEVESLVHPAFEKYRFQGKLGDPTTEHHLDQAIWTQTMARLEQMQEAEITAQTIDREFRTVAAAFNKAIGNQAKETANKVVASKKAAAKEAVTSAAVKGMKKTETSGEVKDKIAKGDFKNAFLDMISGKKL